MTTNFSEQINPISLKTSENVSYYDNSGNFMNFHEDKSLIRTQGKDLSTIDSSSFINGSEHNNQGNERSYYNEDGSLSSYSKSSKLNDTSKTEVSAIKISDNEGISAVKIRQSNDGTISTKASEFKNKSNDDKSKVEMREMSYDGGHLNTKIETSESLKKTNDSGKVMENVNNKLGTNVSISKGTTTLIKEGSRLTFSSRLRLKYKVGSSKMWKDVEFANEMRLDLSKRNCGKTEGRGHLIKADMKMNKQTESEEFCLVIEELEDPVFLDTERSITVEFFVKNIKTSDYIYACLSTPLLCLNLFCMDDGKRVVVFKLV